MYATFCFSVHLFIHSSVDGHLGYFYLLAVSNNAAMNMGVKISVRVPAFNSCGYICRSGIAVSYGNFMFNILRNQHIIFHSGSCMIF